MNRKQELLGNLNYADIIQWEMMLKLKLLLKSEKNS